MNMGSLLLVALGSVADFSHNSDNTAPMQSSVWSVPSADSLQILAFLSNLLP